MSYRFRSEEYRSLELWAVSSSPEVLGAVILRQVGAQEQEAVTVQAGRIRHERRILPLKAHTLYELEFDHCQVSLAYLSECPDLLEHGIRYLAVYETGISAVTDLAKIYDIPDREQFHFGPLRGWMNDPNGLCFYKGRYHLFYQYNPNDEVWGPMYWGHAVSHDLVHWTHLPVVFEPQKEIFFDETLTGGAFSGSAVVDGEILRLFFTRDLRRSDGDAIEYQVTCTSTDGLRFDEEMVFFEKPDDIETRNFRDPKGEKRGEEFHIAVATVERFPEILHAVTDLHSVRRMRPFIEEKTPGITTFECPDVFSLDGRSVACAAWMDYRDDQGRENPIVWYVGDEREDGSIDVESKGLMDFGTSFYAVQSFSHEERRIAIGWVNDRYNEHVRRHGSVNGSQAIPRELHVKDGMVFQLPVKEIYSLLGDRYYEGPGARVQLSPADGIYHVRLDFSEPTRFDLVLARSHSGELTLKSDGRKITIGTKGSASEHIRFETEVSEVKNVEIFVDRRVVEVFVNDGERAGAKTFYSGSRNGCFESRFSNESAVRMTIRGMRGIW